MLSALASSAMLIASLLAQAEPAPAEPPPPPAGSPAPPPDEPRPAGRNAMAVHVRLAHRASDANDGAPATGFSLGATFEHRYATLAERLGLGVGLDLFYDRFSGDGDYVSLVPHQLTQTSFALFQSFSTTLGPVRPWVAVGAGLTIAYFSGTDAANLRVTDSELQPLVRGAAGVDVDVAPRSALVLRADYTHPLNRPTFTGFASPFGDLFDVGVGFLYRF